MSRSRAEKPRLIAKELQVAVSGRDRTLYFHGESMRPLLDEGDEVVVEPVEWEALHLGDIVTYRHLDRFPTRRIVGKSADRLELWCDNWPDRFFAAERADVLGRATARRRGARWVSARSWEWRRARWLALARHARLVRLPPLYWRLRGRIGRVLRALGLRRPRPAPPS